MILVQEVTILPSGTVNFAVRGKKDWENSLSKLCRWWQHRKYSTSLKCECSCIICPNVQTSCPKNGQFSIVGDVIASPASPCRTLMCSTISDEVDVITRWNTVVSYCTTTKYMACYIIMVNNSRMQYGIIT